MLRRHFRPLVKFGLIGFLTAVVYFTVMWIADYLLGLDYLFAVTIAYVAATVFQFTTNRRFTFQASNEAQHKQFIKYLVLLAINYLITVFIVSICVEKVGVSAYVGVCVSVLVTVFVGYFLSSFWVFKNREIK